MHSFTIFEGFASRTKHDNPAKARSSQSLGFSWAVFANRRWFWEILSWCLSVVASIVIVAVLAKYNGNSLPQWPFSITLNAFLSVFSAILTASLVMPTEEAIGQLKWLWFQHKRRLDGIQILDESSRGPWGSVKALWMTKSVHLVSLGSLVVVASIAVSAFVQQTVTYQSHLEAWGESLTPRSQSMFVDDPSLPLASAFYQGMLDINGGGDTTTNSINPNCPSGNCTWPLFSSLGVGSRCENVTNDLKVTPPNGLTCKLTLGRLVINRTDLDDDSSTIINTNYQTIRVPIAGNLLNVSIISQSDTIGGQCSGWQALECALYFNVKQYAANFTNGQYQETAVSEYHNTTFDYTGPGTGQGAAHTEIESPFLLPNYNYTLSAPWAGSPPAHAGVNMSGVKITDNVFWYSLATQTIMWNFLTDRLNGSFFNPINNKQSGFDGVQAIQDNGPEKVFAGLTRSLDVLVRTNEFSPNSVFESSTQGNLRPGAAVGTALKFETYVAVRWRWLILPFALQALAGVFLVMTIIRSSTLGFVPLKNSALPLLALNPAEIISDGDHTSKDSAGSFSTARTVPDLDDAASNIYTTLTGNGARPRAGDREYLVQKNDMHEAAVGS